ncbi:25915_t:CDS:2 [Gigaspora margarita]|uniref:25915_t:CDS:1 n=1 Tax=Gigaspora margarita TaxID=4874 RepID=A0ABM8VW69_GIGMA|nr:25915_t:CDS:2 [Gigaspora margarita]
MSSNFLAYHVASGLWKDNFEKKKRPKLSGNTLFNGGQETDATLPAPSKKRPDLSIKTLL